VAVHHVTPCAVEGDTCLTESGKHTPSLIVKAMERQWANALIQQGEIKFTNVAKYRNEESPTLGDMNEGKGQFQFNGANIDVEYGSNALIFCSSLHTISRESLLETASEGGYDCYISIHDVLGFVGRIKSQLINNGAHFYMMHDYVTYNRGLCVSDTVLQRQKFASNVFQKDISYSHQCEYRLCLLDYAMHTKYREWFKIKIGDCSDIATINSLQ